MQSLPTDDIEITDKASIMLARVCKAYNIATGTLLSILLEDLAYTSFSSMERKIDHFSPSNE